MAEMINVLAVDDDKIVHANIRKALQSDEVQVWSAMNGESGIQISLEKKPDIILLDIEMEGLNGYEVCAQLRENEYTKNIPVIFLSSHATLDKRLKGYEAGADDYLLKPFEAEFLKARIDALLKIYQQRKELQNQYEQARKTAMIAITGSSELGLVMKFLKRALTISTIENLIHCFFETTGLFSLECCVMMILDEKCLWFASEGVMSPLEMELLETSDKNTRILDHGNRTIINYPAISLLVKNMPLEDPEQYGRIKDFLPVMLEAISARFNAFSTHGALNLQRTALLDSFIQIRQNLFSLGEGIVKNRSESQLIMNKLIHDFNYDMLRMGLDEDQEEYLVNRVDTAIKEALKKMDAGKEIRHSLSFIVANLKTIMEKHEILMENYTAILLNDKEIEEDEVGEEIEIF